MPRHRASAARVNTRCSSRGMRGIELGKARTLEPCHQKKNRPSATLSGTAMVRETLAPVGAVLSESEELHMMLPARSISESS